MVTTRVSLVFSLLMGIRSSVPILLSFLLLRSSGSDSAALMLDLQTASISGSIIYLVLFNTLSIEYAKYQTLFLDLAIRMLVACSAVLGLFVILMGSSLYGALILCTIVSSLVFIRARVHLEWKPILLHSVLVVTFVIINSFYSQDASVIIRNWLVFYFATIFFLLFGQLSSDLDLRKLQDILIGLLKRIPKIATVSLIFMLVMYVERKAIDITVTQLDEKKQFLFFMSVINVVSIVGSGFLSIFGPRVAKAKGNVVAILEIYRNNFLFFGLLQLIIGGCCILVLVLFMGFDQNITAYWLKLLMIVSIFYYQLLNQCDQYSDRHMRPVLNSCVFLLFSIFSIVASSFKGGILVFYSLLSIIPVLICSYGYFSEKRERMV